MYKFIYVLFCFPGICLKQNALTGVYLILLLYLPVIKTPTSKNINGKLLVQIERKYGTFFRCNM
jgi:hypothetical protein